MAHANQILSWEENLSSDEMPPEWMWPLSWEVKRHMEKVVADRKAKYETKSTGPNQKDEGPAEPDWVADQADIDDWLEENLEPVS